MLSNEIHNLSIDGFSTRILGVDQLQDIERLFNECSEYFIIEQGKPASVNDAENLLKALPPNRTYNDKVVIGVYNESNKLAALVDIVKDYPEESVWMLGLLLVAPSERGTGLGRTINNELINLVTNKNGTKIRVGVVKSNEVGLRFWESQNYSKVKEAVIKSNGIVNNVIVMNYII